MLHGLKTLSLKPHHPILSEQRTFNTYLLTKTIAKTICPPLNDSERQTRLFRSITFYITLRHIKYNMIVTI